MFRAYPRPVGMLQAPAIHAGVHDSNMYIEVFESALLVRSVPRNGVPDGWSDPLPPPTAALVATESIIERLM